MVRDRFRCEEASSPHEPLEVEITVPAERVLKQHDVLVLAEGALHSNPGRKGISC